VTHAADVMRDQRRAWATPGGAHDRLIRTLAVLLPGAVGVVAAVMVLAPLSPRGEVSFLLDRKKVAVTGERLRVADATYRGIDNKGRAFQLSAGSAVQVSAREPDVTMRNLLATIALNEGPAQLGAPEGVYDFNTERVRIGGPVVFTAADGYRMALSNVDIDLKRRLAIGSGGVSGAIPAGTFSANRIIADLAERRIVLDGAARLRMVPGSLRIPQ
jgi:lipopolysaccharide export system protein LptC